MQRANFHTGINTDTLLLLSLNQGALYCKVDPTIIHTRLFLREWNRKVFSNISIYIFFPAKLCHSSSENSIKQKLDSVFPSLLFVSVQWGTRSAAHVSSVLHLLCYISSRLLAGEESSAAVTNHRV